MAGIIDVRFDATTQMWNAKPRFVYDRASMENGAPIGTGQTLEQAFFRLCDQLPADMAGRLQAHYPRRLYKSPEQELGNKDRCIEVDGHCPSQEEFNRRHLGYMRAKRLAEVLARMKAQ